MELYVFDTLGRRTGIVEGYSSLQWYRRYTAAGNFVLYCSTAYHALLQEDCLLWPSGDGEAGVIESREFQRNREGKETLVVAGRLLTGLLSRRIVWNATAYTGTYEGAMRLLVNENAVNPANADRIIPRLLLGEAKGTQGALEGYAVMGIGLDEALASLSQAGDLGHRVLLNPQSGNMTFEVYKGLDRTYGQRVNNPAVFSAGFENLKSGQYRRSTMGSANVALVSGTKENKDTVLATAGSGAGMARRETHVDARTVKQLPEGGTLLTDAQFITALRQYGTEQLAAAAPVASADAQIETTGNLKYRRDYDLGDLVSVFFDEWGVRANVRLTEIQESTEQGGTTVYAVFGKDAWLPLQYGKE